MTGTSGFSGPEGSENRSECDGSDQLGAVPPEVKASAEGHFGAHVALWFCDVSTYSSVGLCLMQSRYSLGVSALSEHQRIYSSQSTGRVLRYDSPVV